MSDVATQPRVVCDIHDEPLTYDLQCDWWQCPRGDAIFTAEDMYRLASKATRHRPIPEIRLTRCHGMELEP